MTRFFEMVGYDRDDLVSGRLRWTDLTPPEWLERELERLLPQIKRTGSLKPWEKEYFHKDGHRVPVLIGVAPFEDESGGAAFIIDLTERKRAEDAQKCAEAELQQARTALAHRQRVSMLGEVAASLAHEIRQPIAALMIDATACLRALADNRVDVSEAPARPPRASSKRRPGPTRSSRAPSALYRKDTTQRERVDVNAVIREMAVLLQQEAAASSVSIRTELADGLPEVIADRVQLQQVFMNLMLNAIEAMKDTGGDLTITSEMREPDELLISVSDTGVGLPTDTPGTIFDAFVTTKPHGTGMGLAITRSIVESHGGRLWAIANAEPARRSSSLCRAPRGSTGRHSSAGSMASIPAPR